MVNMEVSQNGDTPIAGWFISWNNPLKMDDDWGGTRLAFDPTPMVSHMTLLPFCGRVECEKGAFLASKKEVTKRIVCIA